MMAVEASTEPVPLSDPVQEAQRVLEVSERSSLVVRTLGGVAVHLRAGHRLHPSLRRPLADIDLITSHRHRAQLAKMLEELGYRPESSFNSIHGRHRLLFFDDRNRRQVDVFVDVFVMCHELPLAERLALEPMTLPLAELLITKLQIVKLNEKDRRDLYAMLLTHEVATHDGDAINGQRIASLTARDWGLYKTTSLNLERLREGLTGLDLDEGERALIVDRIARLESMIEGEPKTRKWTMRARVGERVRWYNDPEEVEDELA